MNNNQNPLKRFWFLWSPVILFLGVKFVEHIPDIHSEVVRENKAHQHAIVHESLNQEKNTLAQNHQVFMYSNDRAPKPFFVVPQTFGSMNVGLAQLDMLRYTLTVQANGQIPQKYLNIQEVTGGQLLLIEVVDPAANHQILTQSTPDMPISSVQGNHYSWTIAITNDLSLQNQIAEQKIMETILSGSNASKIYVMSSDYYRMNESAFKKLIDQFDQIAISNRINTKLFKYQHLQQVPVIE